MTQITAQMVKDLREATGAGPLDSKKALEQHGGDMQKAAEWLREKGIAKAVKKLNSGRVMNEGLVHAYLHHNHRVGVLVEVDCETDFVANTQQFRDFAKNLGLHIANLAPKYIHREEIPAEAIEAEKSMQMRILKDDPKNANKPDAILEKIIEGRMDKYYEDLVLMEQQYLLDDTKTIADLLKGLVSELGENIQVRRFARFEIGEGAADENAAE